MSVTDPSCLWDTKLKVWYAVVKQCKFWPWSKNQTLYLYQIKVDAELKCEELNEDVFFGYRYVVQEQFCPTYPDNSIDWSYHLKLNESIPLVQHGTKSNLN